MSDRFIATLGVLVAALAVTVIVTVPAAGQTQEESTYVASRTPWGDPDFQGAWENRTPTPLQRAVKFGTREFLTEEEAAEQAQTRGGLPDGEESVIAADLAAADVAREAQSNSIDPNRRQAAHDSVELIERQDDNQVVLVDQFLG